MAPAVLERHLSPICLSVECPISVVPFRLRARTTPVLLLIRFPPLYATTDSRATRKPPLNRFSAVSSTRGCWCVVMAFPPTVRPTERLALRLVTMIHVHPACLRLKVASLKADTSANARTSDRTRMRLGGTFAAIDFEGCVVASRGIRA